MDLHENVNMSYRGISLNKELPLNFGSHPVWDPDVGFLNELLPSLDGRI